jgi:pimeloyl-ACP methyl ester carboxylesterase
MLDMPELSLRMAPTVKILSPQEVATNLSAILKGKSCHAIGHSFGSIVINWLIRLSPPSNHPPVKKITFIDPVTFFLLNASVAANFCYRPPLAPLDRLVSFFVAKELYVSNALHRHFNWRINQLCPRLLIKMGIQCTVVLSEHDRFVPSKAVKRHIESCTKEGLGGIDIKVKVLDGHAHAQFFVHQWGVDEFIDAFWNTEKAGGKKRGQR